MSGGPRKNGYVNKEGFVARKVFGFILVVVLTGCGQTPPPETYVAIQDSSGVRIVEYRAFPEDLPRYVLDLDDGSTFDSHSTGLDLFGVRGAFLNSDGHVVVADGGNFRILRFAREGQVISSTGRNGQGPGEFSNLTLVAPWLADSLLAWDVAARRLSVFTSEGLFVRTFSLARSDSVRGGFVSDVFQDGSILATGFTDTGGQVTTGRHRYPSPAYHFDADGSLSANLGSIPGTEIYFEAIDGGFHTTPALFSRSTKKLACQDRLVLASNDTYQFETLTPDGTLVQLVRHADPPKPVTAELRRLAEASILDQIEKPEALAGVRSTLEVMPMPETLPAYDRVFADQIGRVWIEDYEVVPGEKSLWRVFDSDGSILFTAEMPRRFEPTDAGQDYVLGISRNDFDVESVVMASLAPRPN
jgi:hypothetical protein